MTVPMDDLRKVMDMLEHIHYGEARLKVAEAYHALLEIQEAVYKEAISPTD